MHVRDAADVEHAWPVPCLRSEESMRIRGDTLQTGTCCLWKVTELSDFIKNILICVPKMNEGLTGSMGE